MKFARFSLIGILVMIGIAGVAAADPFVGVIKKTQGSAVLQRGGESLGAEPGTQVLPADAIKTDNAGSVGVVFSDDTRISMGPDTEIVIEAYQFAPKEARMSFVLRVIRGTVSYISGQITRLSPESVELIVPDATIGTRGTHVLIRVD